MKLGIVGCGAIGSRLALAIDKSFPTVDSIGLSDKDKNLFDQTQKKLQKNSFFRKNYSDLIADVDFVVEAAGVHVSPSVVKESLLCKKPILMLSVGGLVHDETLLDLAKQQKTTLFIPSGSIAGLDALAGMSLSTIESVTLLTKKPLRSLSDPNIWKKLNKDPKSIVEPTCLFKGSAREAISIFPHNVNVAVTLSLKTLGFDKTEISLWTSADWTKNSHEIDVFSSAGHLHTLTENVPLKDNPSTSSLAFFSALAVLEKHLSYTKIGV